MIKALNNCDEVILVLRQVIASQAEIPLDYVLNGETHQGAKLGHVVNTYDEHETLVSSVIVPFSTSDTFIVFDQTEDSEKSRTQILKDDSIDCFTYYRMKFTIYGDAAGTISQKLRARMTTAKVRQALEAEGVHIESFEPVNSMNEYINDVYWQRKDMELIVSCRFNFKQLNVDDPMIVMNDLTTQINTKFARVVRDTLILSRQSRVEGRTLVVSAKVQADENKIILS